MAGFPAASVPTGVGAAGLPVSVQLVAAPGRESVLLALAARLDAPAAGSGTHRRMIPAHRNRGRRHPPEPLDGPKPGP
jgi:Asp-tRNA(Asn)/Glu-tRNA(Gln) amidotransferase A subunit family amidase